MIPPSVEEISSEYEEINLDKIEIRDFERVIGYRDNNPDEEDYTVLEWLKNAEKWEKRPAKATKVDFWMPPETVENYLKDVSEADLDNPRLEGSKFAQNLIESGRSMDSCTSGYLLEVETNEPSDNCNINMIGSPSEIFEYVPLPEEYQEDDYFTFDNGNGKTGIILDDPTLIAFQGLKAAENINENKDSAAEVPSQFIDGMEETIESYIPLKEDF